MEQKDPGHVQLMACYRGLSRLSLLNEKLTVKAGYTRGGARCAAACAMFARCA